MIGRKGYFNVDPVISLPARTPFFPSGSVPPTNPMDEDSSGTVLDKPAQLTLDGIVILSVLAKWMGKTSGWDKMFSEASKRGYNMLHWAPLQQRGGSGSPYSIFDQLKYDEAILEDPQAKDGGLKEIEGAISLAREKFGLGAVTDVVLNHTAFDSPWLEEHPEAGEWCSLAPVYRADPNQATHLTTPLIWLRPSSWKMPCSNSLPLSLPLEPLQS